MRHRHVHFEKVAEFSGDPAKMQAQKAGELQWFAPFGWRYLAPLGWVKFSPWAITSGLLKLRP
ncbi:MAG: hypothetical protein ACRC8Q_07855 [Aeromonas sp.]